MWCSSLCLSWCSCFERAGLDVRCYIILLYIYIYYYYILYYYILYYILYYTLLFSSDLSSLLPSPFPNLLYHLPPLLLRSIFPIPSSNLSKQLSMNIKRNPIFHHSHHLLILSSFKVYVSAFGYPYLYSLQIFPIPIFQSHQQFDPACFIGVDG